MKKFIIALANSQRYFIHALRIGIFITLIVFSGVKVFSIHGDYMSYTAAFFIVTAAAMTFLGIWFYKVGLIGALALVAASAIGLFLFLFQLLGEINEHLLWYLMFTLCRLIILLTIGLICAADCAKQIFRQYVLRMG